MGEGGDLKPGWGRPAKGLTQRRQGAAMQWFEGWSGPGSFLEQKMAGWREANGAEERGKSTKREVINGGF